MNKNLLVRNDHDEYQQIKKDLVFVVILNILFFSSLLALYFFNRSTGQVDTFFANLLKF